MERFLSKTWLICIAFVSSLMFAALLMFLPSLNDSPTSDEPPHILSGYTFLKHGHDFIDIEHPHLTKAIASLPLFFQNVTVNLYDSNYQTQQEEIDIGRMFAASRDFFVFENNSPDAILLSSRIPMILLTLAFAFPLFFFTKKLFGKLAAVVAVFLYCSEPFILANGPLVNTDIVASGFFFSSIFALLLYSHNQNRKTLLFLGFSLAGAVLTKFSTFYLVPIVLLLMEVIFRVNDVKGKRKDYFVLIGIILVSILLFYGIIGFRERGLESFLALNYFKGLLLIFLSVTIDQRFSYLNGESYIGGRWYYFPILLIFKTHITTLVLSVAGGVLLFLKKANFRKLDLLITFFPATIFFGLALISSFNIGLRHILPVYPFIILLAAFAISFAFHYLKERFSLNLAYLLILLLLVFRIASLATTYPNFLSYYNFLGGGTENGWKIANDANYDWGQDVKRMAKYVKDTNIKSIAFDNYTGDYAARLYYDLPTTGISPKDTNYKGYLALSTSVITYHENRPNNYDWVTENYEPIAKAGKSIFIYKIE